MNNVGLLKLVNDGLNGDSFHSLVALKEALTENIRLETLKSNGTKPKDIKIIEKITKKASQNPLFGMAHQFDLNNTSYLGFLQGHYLLASQNNFGFEEAPSDKKFKINTFLNVDMFEQTQIKIDMNDLKVFCKTTSKTHVTPYVLQLDDFRVGVNPFYLLDMLQFNDTDFVIVNTSNRTAPICTANDDKVSLGMVLPIRLKD